ncbi:MAG: hypothetical protein GTO45_05740 [Candidatus Aminicenantes bacterium]|nr:hypothetical protein [Candidatus Aminicenantes bacterium]NIM78352.1 hypothetical protein [Candidatus Aminicenantes bacterium]NIN17586.1 hypothetical protein [Candidatus Aminicenantes bacterium]NIN41464.1 hypothetical protein [Candidatus Aminicenantes bacterium]NIN84238.1 hypothetical protein [Candidatus Aminicenantes bacterium]
MYKDVSKNISIYELISLVHIPEVNKIIESALEELKRGTFSPCILDYESKKKYYYQSLFEDLNPGEGDSEGSDGFYWFELTQFDEWQWRMTYIDPNPPSHMHYYQVLPRDVIDGMAHTLVNPDKVITMKAVHSKSLNKKVDLQFVKFSPIHMFGTVKQTAEVRKNKGKKRGVSLEGDLEMAYRVFFDYVRKFPDLSKEFIQDFLTNMLPQLKQMEAEQKNGGKHAGNRRDQ